MDSEKEVKTDSKARTAENVGYEILNEICNVVDRNIYSEDILREITPIIESYATEYAEARVREAERLMLITSVAQVSEARAEGYEAARKDLAAIHTAKWAKEDFEKGYKAGQAAGQIAMRERAANDLEACLYADDDPDPYAKSWNAKIRHLADNTRSLSIEEKA